MLRGKSITSNTYIIKKFQINNLIFQLKKLENEDQTEHKARRKKEITKASMKINEKEHRKNKQNLKFFLWKDQQISKPLIRLRKKRERRLKLLKSRMKEETHFCPYINEKDYKKIEYTIVCQQIW